jgi:hypothetical protein
LRKPGHPAIRPGPLWPAGRIEARQLGCLPLLLLLTAEQPSSPNTVHLSSDLTDR